MDIVRFTEALTYTSKGHEDVSARRLQGGEASSADFATVGISSFPNGAIVPMDVGKLGRIYVVTEGSITIEKEDGELYVLHCWDSIFIPAGEARAVRNESGATSSIIVISPVQSQEVASTS